jgi:hypothetical protein
VPPRVSYVLASAVAAVLFWSISPDQLCRAGSVADKSLPLS